MVEDAVRFIKQHRDAGKPPPDDIYTLPDGNIMLEWFWDEHIARLEVAANRNHQLMLSIDGRKNSIFLNMTW